MKGEDWCNSERERKKSVKNLDWEFCWFTLSKDYHDDSLLSKNKPEYSGSYARDTFTLLSDIYFTVRDYPFIPSPQRKSIPPP